MMIQIDRDEDKGELGSDLASRSREVGHTLVLR